MSQSRFLQLVEDEKKRRAQAEAEANKTQSETFDSDLVPDDEYKRTDEQIEIDTFIDNIPILDAYRKYTPYKVYHRPGQTESIKLRCPNPSHTDEEPSYSVNTNKNTGKCFRCEAGYDVKDLAAFHFDYPVPDYKKNGDFPKLMRDIAESYGYRVERTLGGQDLVWRESEDSSDKTDNSPKPDNSDIPDSSDNTDNPDKAPATENENRSDSNVAHLFEGDGFEITLPSLNWEELLPATDTFLDQYMTACRVDEAPEEYHLFNAMIALGFVAGRDVTLASKLPVYGNLFICALGKSGAGKSTAGRHLRRLMRESMPYDHSDPNSKGVTNITPSSAEVLVDSFSKPITDPTDPKRIIYYAGVKGLIDFNELSGLIGRASRQGNVLKPIMMDFFDMNDEIKVQSRGAGTAIAAESFASCITTAQPAALRDLLRDSDDASGFLNRWVFIGGAQKQRTIMGTGTVDLSGPVAALDRIKGWISSFKKGEQITWTQEAIAAMQQFFDERVYPLSKGDTNIFVRMDLLCLKLALLFSINKMEKQVTLTTVQTITKMYSYILACYGVPADQIGNTLENEMTEAIIYQMKRLGKKEGTSLNAIALALKRRKYPKEMILRNIKSLIELGFVEEITNSAGQRGRPTKRYRYVA